MVAPVIVCRRRWWRQNLANQFWDLDNAMTCHWAHPHSNTNYQMEAIILDENIHQSSCDLNWILNLIGWGDAGWVLVVQGQEISPWERPHKALLWIWKKHTLLSRTPPWRLITLSPSVRGHFKGPRLGATHESGSRPKTDEIDRR